ncbi:MAG: hypothetical protein CMK59_00730 [Proteobacteria bacterium]|nr:hypothetical protein [Pseudomonadota bacterium]
MFPILLFACSNPVTLSGEIQDIWGNAISGATVKMKGSDTEQISNSEGQFSFSLEKEPTEQKKYSFRADAEGFLYGTSTFEYYPEAQRPEDAAGSITIELYKELDKTGFYIVGKQNYEALESEKIKLYATELEQIIGIKDIGSSEVTTNNLLFKSSLRQEQIKQLDLKLHRFEFQEKRLIKGVTGPQEIDLDLWLPKEEIAYVLKGMNEDSHFLIEFKDLSPGIYAFSSNGLMENRRSLNSIPEEQQLVFPFEKK